MSAFQSLIVIAAIASFATVSVAQAGSGRKVARQAPIVLDQRILDSNAAYVPKTPAWSYQGTRGLSSPAGRS